tara:strand:+ start:11723 stop:14818 length:3096 start_codon:yes stop_codon:yes gene_type:complete
MASFYEKRGNMASPSLEGAPNVSQSPEGYGLGISGPRLQGGWPEAQSGSSMFPIGQAAGAGNQLQMPQYALTPPSGGNADVAGIQQAMERFKKMGTDMSDNLAVEKRAALWDKIMRGLVKPRHAAGLAKRKMGLTERSKDKLFEAAERGLGKSNSPIDEFQSEYTSMFPSPVGGTNPFTGKPTIGAVADTKEWLPMMRAGLQGKEYSRIGWPLAGLRREIKRGSDDLTESKLRNLAAKYAAQDNSLDSRSATGEGKGLTYKTNDDDHATGTAAWDSLGQYMKTADEANVSAYIEGGMNERSAIKKAYPDWSDTQIDAFLSSYNKRAADLEKEAWVGSAISAAARVGSKVLPWAARGLGWGAKGGKTIAKGVSKVPGMYRAAGGGAKGVAAGGKQLSRSVLGRAPGGAGRYARGTGVRGLAGRNPITTATLGMGLFGGGVAGGGESPQAQGGPGGGGYGLGGGGGGYQPGQQDQWNPDWEQTTQPVGHTPKEASMNIKAACDATGLTPYQLTFAVRVHEADLSPQQIEEGINKAGEYMGEEYVEELREGMDKLASMDKEALGSLLAKAVPLLAKLAPKAAKIGKGAKNLLKAPTRLGSLPVSQSSRVGHVANKLFQPGKGGIGAGTTLARGKGWKKTLGLLGGGGEGLKGAVGKYGLGTPAGWGGAMRMAGGAMTGNVAAGEDAPWYVKYPMMAGGAAFGRAMPRMGAPARAAGGRALTGGFMGMVGDETAGLAGIDTGGRFGQLGALGGFASPLVKGQKLPGWTAKIPGGKGFGPAGTRFSRTRTGPRSLPDLSPGGAISQRGAATAAKYLGKPGTARNFASQAGLYSSPALAGAGIAGVGGAIDSKVEAARQKSMQEVMSNPKIQNALEMAEQGGGFMKSISGMAGVIDPILKLIGIDPSQMNPLMKIMLMAGGGLGIGGLLSGSKGAGMGGLATMAVPLIAQYMKQQQGGGAPSAPSGLDQAVGQEDARFTAQERAFFESLPQAQQDSFSALSPEDQASMIQQYRGEQTELEKATGERNAGPEESSGRF